ncbi:MAG: hypothetical protein Q4D23_00330 [Bacteroidales bacterium]|nr:hypothetical protein [Bacteroidales bacterium]
MTHDEKQTLHLFEMRVRQLLLNHKDLLQENAKLRAMVEERDKAIEQQKEENSQLQQRYNDLKTAKMIDVSSAEAEGAQKRLAKLIREVDKCIALINV